MSNVTAIRPPAQSGPAVSGPLARGLSFIQLNNGLWRLTRTDGSVLGYVEQPSSARSGYVAKRLSGDRRSFFTLGEFRSFDEALECLRFS